MAIYSNFDGTFKDTIQIGKQGPKISNDDQNFKLLHNDGVALSTIEVAAPISANHASTKSYVDLKFGTDPTQVRTNAQSDALYQQTSEKNIAEGYVGLDANGKIESQFLPDGLAINATYTVHNFEERNAKLVDMGDIAVIVGIPLWSTNKAYVTGDIVRVPTLDVVPSGHYFYSAKINHTSTTEPVGDDTEWAITTFVPGMNAWTIGQEVLYDRQVYISLVNETHDKIPTDTSKWRSDDYMDSGLYICSKLPAGGNGNTTVDSDWTPVDFGAPVSSFNGRIGAVQPEANDYTASQIKFTPTLPFIKTTVQDAIIETRANYVKKSGDSMSGALSLASSTAALPSLHVGSNAASGLYGSLNNAIAISYNGVEKIRFDSTIFVNADINMSTKRIINLAEPTTSTDAATKAYVDSKPVVTKSSFVPAPLTGKESDVHYRTKVSGNIEMPVNVQWNSIANDGRSILAINNEFTNPLAAISDDNGETWSSVNMPAASSASDKYNITVTNGVGHFLSVRKNITPSSSTGQLVYTTDSGKNWASVSSSNFPWPGAFIAANSSQGSNYVLLDANGAFGYYSLNSGANWTRVSLPQTGIWVSAAGRGALFVAIDKTGVVIRSTDGGVTWTLNGTALSPQQWNNISTYNGVNFVAVGQENAGTGSTKSAYSNDGGETWIDSTMPSLSYWKDVETNGSSYVAVQSNSDKAAKSIDGGATWQTITLPRVGSFERLTATSNAYAMLDISGPMLSPVVISKDGGTTWVNTIVGGIDNIFIKQGADWLAYTGISIIQADARYVAKTGDKMTGRLVIDSGTIGYSIQTSGGITGGHSVESVMQMLNQVPVNTAGKMVMGTLNEDSVTAGKAYRWKFATQGNYAGYSLKLQSMMRNGVDVDRMVFDADSTLLYSPVGIGKSSKSSELHVDMGVGKTNAGITVYNEAGRANIELFAKDATGTTSLIAAYGNVTAVNYSATKLASSTLVFNVNTKGYVKCVGGYTAGTGSISDITRYKAYIADGQIGVNVDSSNAIVNAENTYAVDIKSRINSELSSTYAHIRVTEGAVNVLNLGKAGLTINKRVGIGAEVSANAQLYVGGTDAIRIPVGTTAQRPVTPEIGMIRQNTTASQTEIYTGTEWSRVNVGSYNRKVSLSKSSWVLDTGTTYKITILKSEHELGNEVYCAFQSKVPSGNYRGDNFEYEVTATGDITIYADVDSAASLPDIKAFIYN